MGKMGTYVHRLTKTVNQDFGATGYGHNISKGARKSFRARHGCDKASTKKNKLSARYWACKDLWSKSSPKKTTGTKGRVAKRRK